MFRLTKRRFSKKISGKRNAKLAFELLEERRLLSADGVLHPCGACFVEEIPSPSLEFQGFENQEIVDLMKTVCNTVSPGLKECDVGGHNDESLLWANTPDNNISTFLAETENDGDEIEEWDIELGASGGCEMSQSSQAGVFQLHEGHGSVLDHPGSLADPASSDFFTLTLPALPDGYSSIITCAGSATYGSDYYLYDPANSLISFYDGYEHMGAALTLRLVIIDDRATEADEFFSISMSAPEPFIEEPTPYDFNLLNTSVSATIIDNDGWIVGLVSEEDDDENIVISETSSEQTRVRVSLLDNGTDRGSDLHYPVNVTLAISGTTSSSDYSIYLNGSNGVETLITPNSSGRFTVCIQENEEYAVLTIKAQDDSIVERLEETLNLTIVEARGYPPFNLYAHDSTPLTITVKDNDKLTLGTIQFKNNLDLVSDTLESFRENWKDQIHWYYYDPSQTLPVAYSSDSTMRCNITVGGHKDPTCTYQVRMKWYYNTSNSNNFVYSDWTTIGDVTTRISLNSSFVELFGGQRAYYDLESTFMWEFRTTSESTRGDEGSMGPSSNPIYVTYKQPTLVSDESFTDKKPPSLYFHSLIHIGCVAASSVSGNDETVFQALWNKVASKSIYKVKLENGVVRTDALLTYYGKPIDHNSSEYSFVKNYVSITRTSEGNYIQDQDASLARGVCVLSSDITWCGYTVDTLLYYKDGTCGTWQSFFINLCALQGINCKPVGITAKNTTGGSEHEPDIALKVKPTLTGQGGGIPLENTWGNHAVVLYNGNVYDPSYGVCYGAYSNKEFLTSFIPNLESVGILRSQSHLGYGWVYEPKKTTTEILTSYLWVTPYDDDEVRQ